MQHDAAAERQAIDTFLGWRADALIFSTPSEAANVEYAAARRVPGHVVGDGRKSIAELVEVVNADPRRGVGHENVLTRIELSAAS